jgi:hypothetical protein
VEALRPSVKLANRITSLTFSGHGLKLKVEKQVETLERRSFNLTCGKEIYIF